MKLAIFASAAALSLCAAGVAFAQESGALSDSQFVRANRCLGLASSGKLDGATDASALASKLKEAAKGRPAAILSRATEAREGAWRAANKAGASSKVALAAERDGAECKAFQS